MNFLVLLGLCPPRRFLFLAFIWLLPVLLPSYLSAQEICDNGIDDDMDGLVDLNDSLDCVCTEPSGTFSILPNASFEDFNPDNEGCFTAEPDGKPDNLEQTADVGVYAYRIRLELAGERTVQLEGMVTLVR